MPKAGDSCQYRDGFSLHRNANRLFIDTSALVALADKTDQHHSRARNFLLGATGFRWFCIDAVTCEAFTTLRSRAGYDSAERGLVLSRQLHIRKLSIHPIHQVRARKKLRKFREHKISYTDALLSVAMDENEAYRIFSFDSDFIILGYEVLPF